MLFLILGLWILDRSTVQTVVWNIKGQIVGRFFFLIDYKFFYNPEPEL